MKKKYEKPQVKKVGFQYTKVVAASGGYCDQGWTQGTNLDPNISCDKCRDKLIWLNATDPF